MSTTEVDDSESQFAVVLEPPPPAPTFVVSSDELDGLMRPVEVSTSHTGKAVESRKINALGHRARISLGKLWHCAVEGDATQPHLITLSARCKGTNPSDNYDVRLVLNPTVSLDNSEWTTNDINRCRWTGLCSCLSYKGGKPRCKHSVALLMAYMEKPTSFQGYRGSSEDVVSITGRPVTTKNSNASIVSSVESSSEKMRGTQIKKRKLPFSLRESKADVPAKTTMVRKKRKVCTQRQENLIGRMCPNGDALGPPLPAGLSREDVDAYRMDVSEFIEIINRMVDETTNEQVTNRSDGSIKMHTDKIEAMNPQQTMSCVKSSVLENEPVTTPKLSVIDAFLAEEDSD